ncbi:hypothetical protein TELCIR_17237 [Teladorsagia circumcincta]|uniref:Uncharacterized protein n=1 Tax=Teladorsagia circumcincta TaxID=45464 RepID=A0A2G9TTI4_TELCI|nr:hypothetical protein TELCIR_17237 [Teladorsagia circumcincta]
MESVANSRMPNHCVNVLSKLGRRFLAMIILMSPSS